MKRLLLLFTISLSFSTFSQTAKEFFDSAKVKFDSGSYSEAIKEFTKVLELDSIYKEAHRLRGTAYYNIQEYTLAILDFENAVKKFGEEEIVNFNLALAKDELGESEQAILELTKVIKLNPKFGDAYFFRANLKSSLGDKYGAISDYTKFINTDNPSRSINNTFPKAYLKRGRIKSNLGDFNGAIEDLTQAIKIEPLEDDLFYERFQIKLKSNDLDSAAEDINKAITINPESALYFESRGKLNIKKSNFDAGILDFHKAVELMKIDGFAGLTVSFSLYPAYEQRALFKYNSKDYKEALSDYNKILELDKIYDFLSADDEVKIFLHIARQEVMLENYYGAISTLTKVIELNPSEPILAFTFFLRGSAKSYLNDYKNACKDYTKAVNLGYEDEEKSLSVYCN